MSAILTIAIPTRNRAKMLEQCLESIGLQRSISLRDVDVVVSDNASTDDTDCVASDNCYDLDLKYIKNQNNIGFDGNYMQCLRNASADYVWVLGDDDALMPGALEAILGHIELGADFISMAPIETDVALNPLRLKNWYGGPSEVFDTSRDLLGYLNVSNYQACMGAFISSMVLPRKRVLAHAEKMEAEAKGGYCHLWGIVPEILMGAKIHWEAMPMFLNRLGNDSMAKKDPYERFMMDVRVWAKLGRELMADTPEIRKAFNGIHIRNFNGVLRQQMGWLNLDPVRYHAMDNLMKELGY